MIEGLLWYGGLSALSLALAAWLLSHSRARARAAPPGSVRVVVRGRYEPEVIVAAAGEPLRITFRREDTLACSEHVVFPDFGKSAMLPLHEDVVVELVPERPGEYEFTCQLGMLRGRLVVTDDGRRAVAQGNGRPRA